MISTVKRIFQSGNKRVLLWIQHREAGAHANVNGWKIKHTSCTQTCAQRSLTMQTLHLQPVVQSLCNTHTHLIKMDICRTPVLPTCHEHLCSIRCTCSIYALKPQHVVGLTVFSLEKCFQNHPLSRDADAESTLKSRTLRNRLGLDIGKFPRGLSEFTGPSCAAFTILSVSLKPGCTLRKLFHWEQIQSQYNIF